MTDEKIQQLVNMLKDQIFDKFNLNTMTDDQLEDVIEEMVQQELSEEYVSISERVEIGDRIFGSIRGLGILDTIL